MHTYIFTHTYMLAANTKESCSSEGEDSGNEGRAHKGEYVCVCVYIYIYIYIYIYTYI